MYNPLTPQLIQEVASIVGSANIIADQEQMLDYAHDEYAAEEVRTLPELVVKPQSPQEIAQIVKLCNRERVPLTPRGAGTGLCGGCVAVQRGIVLCFERLNRVLEVDNANLTATVQTGVTLQEFYQAVEAQGLFFPPHPGDETAMIGGVIATNAGGARAVKYGVIRNFVKGIEVVLPSGQIETIGGKYIKNSSGYSLLNLLIGSEGTLGIMTKATISLLSPPNAVYTLVVPFRDLHRAIGTVPKILQSGILPMAVEFIEIEPIRVSEAALERVWPSHEGQAHLMFIVDGSSEDEVLAMAERIQEICLANDAVDVLVADSREKQQNVLEIRSQIYATMKNHLMEILDVTVPRADIAAFVADTQALAEEFATWLPTYGHAADGNVHAHIMKERFDGDTWSAIPNHQAIYQPVRDRIHELGKQYGGIVSGEHGIGLAKKNYLPAFVGPTQIELMRGIKALFDPNNILNPGKIL